MKTRTRTRVDDLNESTFSPLGTNIDLESLSDEELEALLFEEEKKSEGGFWNLPTVAGLSLIVVGVAYLFQELGIYNGFDVSVLASMLPWLAGILIILLGFGVLSWRPKRSKPKATVRKTIEVPSGKERIIVESKSTKSGKRKRLVRSRNKKIAGVCGGIAEYFSIDPTLVRIAFVIGTIATQGSFLLAYLILSFVMPKPEPLSLEERITIIRDS